MSKIMIVDDHQDIIDTINDAMTHAGHKTCTAINGQNFLDNVEKEKPDLVLLDVMMPGLTTKQILDGLREKKLSKLKIILVTVVRFAENEKKKLLKNSNIVDYITKPFSIIELIEHVKVQLK